MTSEVPMLDILKARYFKLAAREHMGWTPFETEKLDYLESAIRELQSPAPAPTVPPLQPQTTCTLTV